MFYTHTSTNIFSHFGLQLGMQASEILNNAETGLGLWILIMKTKQEHEEWDMHYIKKMHAFCAIWGLY